MVTKKQLFKILKKEKVFSKFCLYVANRYRHTENPRFEKDRYISLFDTINKDTLCIFVVKLRNIVEKMQVEKIIQQ